jgi:recombination protein RecR
MRLAQPLEDLIDQLHKLPGVGPKSAQRMALFILKLPEREIKQLARSIVTAHEKIFPCPLCGNLTETDPCSICSDSRRVQDALCILEESGDVIAMEKTGYNGQYYVLNRDFNASNALDWVDMDFTPLFKRLQSGAVKEVILALDPDIDGEVMSRIISGKIEDFGVKITRLAHGLPVGGDIEYADEITLRQALEGRKEYS